jgi:hypothetical protein
MIRFISAIAIALSAAVSLGAQDTSVKSKVKVEADDARTMTLTGCLQRGPANIYTLRGTSAIAGDETTVRSRVKTDVDDDGDDVKTEARTEIDRDGDRQVGTSGLIATYELSPQQGVDFASHVGKQVQIVAVALDAKNGDDDAEVKVTEQSEVRREDAPDSKVKSRVEAEIPRGKNAKVTVLSVKPMGTSCNN